MFQGLWKKNYKFFRQRKFSFKKYIQWIKDSIDNHYKADDNFEPLSSDLRIKDGTASSSTILDAHKKYQEKKLGLKSYKIS